MTTTTTAINARHLCAAIHCAGKKDVRYYLNGVYVEALPDETRVVATDGYKLAVFRSATANPEPFSIIIPRATVEAFVKLVKGVKFVDLTITDGTGRLSWANGSLPFDPIDARFPEYRRTFPQDTSGETAQFNPELLIAFSKVAKALGAKACPEIVHNGSGAALVRINAVHDFAGVLMPFRQRVKTLDVPDVSWVAR